MSNNLYVTATGPQSGKILVVLGLMEILTQRMGRVAFFRPVSRADCAEGDSHLKVIVERYKLDYDEKALYGVTSDEAKSLLLKEQEDQLEPVAK